MKALVVLIQAGTLVAGLTLAGCGGEPYTYVPGHELKPGPGLVTGEAGALAIPGSTGSAKQQEKRKETNQTP